MFGQKKKIAPLNEIKGSNSTGQRYRKTMRRRIEATLTTTTTTA